MLACPVSVAGRTRVLPLKRLVGLLRPLRQWHRHESREGSDERRESVTLFLGQTHFGLPPGEKAGKCGIVA